MIKLIKKTLLRIIPKIQDTEYKNIYSSRKVIKNKFLYSKNNQPKHYYDLDIWGLANEQLKPFLQKSLSIYSEIVGYLPSGKQIQKGYDYGCQVGEFKIFIYRITLTNIDGQVHEFSAKEVQDWCSANGLNAVPELYYGYAKDLFKELWIKHHGIQKSHENKNKKILQKYGCKEWNTDLFLTLLKEEYLEKDSILNITPMPEEGVVIKIEGYNQECYKLKSTKFLELETKNLDTGESNIEDNQDENESEQ